MRWRAGDLALCVRLHCLLYQPQTGVIYKVIAVHAEDGLCGLEIDGVPCDPGYDGWDSTGFRKVTPDCEIEGIEAENRRKEPAW